MACGDYATYAEFIREGQMFDALYCPFGDQLGGTLFALMVFGAIGMSLYIYSGSVVLPLVLFLIVGSVIIVQLPSAAVQLVGIVILLGITGIGYLMVQRTRRTVR